MTRTTHSAATRDLVVASTASAGPATWAMGALFERLVNATDTGGMLGASVVTQPAGAASPRHVHTQEAEAWYILDGDLTDAAGSASSCPPTSTREHHRTRRRN